MFFNKKEINNLKKRVDELGSSISKYRVENLRLKDHLQALSTRLNEATKKTKKKGSK